MTTTPAIYDARLTHVRRDALHREFSHRVSMWLVDLAHLPRLPWWLRPLARFKARDHLGPPDRSIRENIDAWVRRQGIDLAGGRVLMLTNPRVLGYVFNPLTVYWCHTSDGELADLHITGRRSFGPHCARTLAAWRDRFTRASGAVATLGFDETFRRMWKLYLAYSEAGFRSGYLDVWQYQLSKPES